MAKKAVKKPTAAKHKVRFSDSHPGHSQHLCELVRERKMGRVAQLSKGASCICLICGRAASRAGNLCEAVDI